MPQPNDNSTLIARAVEVDFRQFQVKKVLGEGANGVVACSKYAGDNPQIMAIAPSGFVATKKNKDGTVDMQEVTVTAYLADQDAGAAAQPYPRSVLVKYKEGAGNTHKLATVSEVISYGSDIQGVPKAHDMEEYLKIHQRVIKVGEVIPRICGRDANEALHTLFQSMHQAQDALHARGVLHLDTANRNFLVEIKRDENGAPHLCVRINDFGLSQVMKEGKYGFGMCEAINPREAPIPWMDKASLQGGEGRLTIHTDHFAMRATMLEAMGLLMNVSFVDVFRINRSDLSEKDKAFLEEQYEGGLQRGMGERLTFKEFAMLKAYGEYTDEDILKLGIENIRALALQRNDELGRQMLQVLDAYQPYLASLPANRENYDEQAISSVRKEDAELFRTTAERYVAITNPQQAVQAEAQAVASATAVPVTEVPSASASAASTASLSRSPSNTLSRATSTASVGSENREQEDNISNKSRRGHFVTRTTIDQALAGLSGEQKSRNKLRDLAANLSKGLQQLREKLFSRLQSEGHMLIKGGYGDIPEGYTSKKSSAPPSKQGSVENISVAESGNVSENQAQRNEATAPTSSQPGVTAESIELGYGDVPGQPPPVRPAQRNETAATASSHPGVTAESIELGYGDVPGQPPPVRPAQRKEAASPTSSLPGVTAESIELGYGDVPGQPPPVRPASRNEPASTTSSQPRVSTDSSELGNVVAKEERASQEVQEKSEQQSKLKIDQGPPPKPARDHDIPAPPKPARDYETPAPAKPMRDHDVPPPPKPMRDHDMPPPPKPIRDHDVPPRRTIPRDPVQAAPPAKPYSRHPKIVRDPRSHHKENAPAQPTRSMQASSVVTQNLAALQRILDVQSFTKINGAPSPHVEEMKKVLKNPRMLPEQKYKKIQDIAKEGHTAITVNHAATRELCRAIVDKPQDSLQKLLNRYSAEQATTHRPRR